MPVESLKPRILALLGVIAIGLAVGGAFWWDRPFDIYLVHQWERELATLPDDVVPVRLEQIAALGERSLPTLVGALHSERQIVAENALLVLQQELSKLELRSTKEAAHLVSGVAAELAEHSHAPGPYSGPGSMWLATRILLWPIDRKLVDGERLAADCELVIRSAAPSARGFVIEPADDEGNLRDGLVSIAKPSDPAELPPQVAGGGLPMQLMVTPSLPPQDAPVVTDSRAVSIAEPKYLSPAQAPSDFAANPITAAARDATAQPIPKPSASDSRQPPGTRRDALSQRRDTAARPDLQSLADLDVMRKLAEDDEALAREAVDELYRRGFQTKHFRLAEILVDPDPNVRLRFVQSLPQMSEIDSRPWLLWLSRDPEPAVRRAAIAVIATSSDPALQQRVRELEGEETNEEVLQAVRQILSSGQARTIR